MERENFSEIEKVPKQFIYFNDVRKKIEKKR
jgi:hypothetical protein